MDTPKKPEICVVYCTVPPDHSAEIARELLERRLVACVNISPVRSLYRWEGHICDEGEDLLIMKTRDSLLGDLTAVIRMIHPYEIPEIIAIPVIHGSEPYRDWVLGETE
jgi:periplasmic divalent cation tolerance protein